MALVEPAHGRGEVVATFRPSSPREPYQLVGAATSPTGDLALIVHRKRSRSADEHMALVLRANARVPQRALLPRSEPDFDVWYRYTPQTLIGVAFVNDAVEIVVTETRGYRHKPRPEAALMIARLDARGSVSSFDEIVLDTQPHSDDVTRYSATLASRDPQGWSALLEIPSRGYAAYSYEWLLVSTLRRQQPVTPQSLRPLKETASRGDRLLVHDIDRLAHGLVPAIWGHRMPWTIDATGTLRPLGVRGTRVVLDTGGTLAHVDDPVTGNLVLDLGGQTLRSSRLIRDHARLTVERKDGTGHNVTIRTEGTGYEVPLLLPNTGDDGYTILLDFQRWAPLDRDLKRPDRISTGDYLGRDGTRGWLVLACGLLGLPLLLTLGATTAAARARRHRDDRERIWLHHLGAGCAIYLLTAIVWYAPLQQLLG